MMEFCSELFADAFEALILVDFLTRYFGRKPGVRYGRLLFAAATLLMSGVLITGRLCFDADIRLYAVYVLPLFLYAVLFLGERAAEKFFAAVFTVSVCALLRVLTELTVDALFVVPDASAFPEELLPRLIGLLLLAAATRLLLLLRRKSAAAPWILLLAVSGVSLTMAAVLLWIVLSPDKEAATFILYRVIYYNYAPYIRLCAAGILVLNLAVYLLTAVLTQTGRIRTENALLKQMRRYEEKNAELLRTSVEESRELRHDMKQHLERLSAETDALTVLEGEELRAGIGHLRKAFVDLYGRYAASGYVVYTGNRTLDALLTYKFGYAKEHGIAVTMDITADAAQIGDADLCVILGNLTDNAIEACLRMPENERELAVTLSEKENFLYLAITNTTDGETTFDTVKEDREFHGLGIQSVRKTVRAYGGLLRYENRDERHLTAEVLLRKR